MPVDTGTLNKPALCYPRVSGYSLGANLSPDTAVTDKVIPLVLLSYTGPHNQQQQNYINTIPLINYNTSTVWGGSTAGTTTKSFTKVSIEGFIDTPFTGANDTSNRTSSITMTAATPILQITYADYILACWDGSANAQFAWWSRVEPLWFRDPYGRRFDNPRVLEFTANYVEAVPFRTNFTMQLVVS